VLPAPVASAFLTSARSSSSCLFVVDDMLELEFGAICLDCRERRVEVDKADYVLSPETKEIHRDTGIEW
jgi:hypothetical protein